MFYMQELVDLTKDSKEARICVDIAGYSLVPSNFVIHKVVVDDSTEKGKELLKMYLSKGYWIVSKKD
jgi:hypothetical protein